MSLDLSQSLHTPHLRGNVGRVPGITAWKASFFWWRVTSVQMVRSGYMEVTGGVTISFLHNIISTSNFLSISLAAQSWALHQQSDRNPLARGHCLKLQCCNYRHCHSGCKTSTRWSSVSTEISTTDPKAFCGKGMKWRWAWGEPCCPLPRRGLEDRESVLGTLCLKTMLWQKNTMERSNITETGRSVGEESQGAARMADIQLSGHQRSCLSQRFNTPHSRVRSYRWKSKMTVLRNNKSTVFLISPFSSSFYFWKTLCSSVLGYFLYIKIPDVPLVPDVPDVPETEVFPEA